MNKLTRLTGTIALATSALTATSAFADMSYNLGYASEYHFRGILQKNSSYVSMNTLGRMCLYETHFAYHRVLSEKDFYLRLF